MSTPLMSRSPVWALLSPVGLHDVAVRSAMHLADPQH